MANNLNKKNIWFEKMARVAQINGFYCGPASLQMLLSFQGVEIDQEHIVDTLKIEQKIKSQGMTIEEVGKFVKNQYPQFQFWFKFMATMQELSQLVNEYHYPVGVEWQGIFDYPEEEAYDDEDDDPGHIAVITAVNTSKNYIYIADPDRHYAGKDRKFSILQFERRWWDINEVVNPKTNKKEEVDDYHGLFVITPKEIVFPNELNLKRI